MEKNKNGFQFAQGVDREQLKQMSQAQCRAAVKRDAQLAAQLLLAVSEDENTCNALADFLFGRIQNALHREELAKQTELEV